MTAAPARHLRAVLATMRNEGLGLLEWVAYHRAIGFDRVIVATNDCQDGTDAMLDILQDMGEATHLPHLPPPGTSPQESGCAIALAHPVMADVEWVLHVDADEFLHVSCGEGRVDDLLAAVGDCDAIAITWRMFGGAGFRIWPGGSFLEQLTRTQSWMRLGRTMHKSMFRPDRFGRVYSHLPKDPVTADVVLKNTAGAVMPTGALFHPTQVRHKDATRPLIVWLNADIHHYAIRSEDIFLLKNVRGDGLSLEHAKYLRGSPFWTAADRNDIEDRAILRHLPAVHDRLSRYRADPRLARLEADAFRWFAGMRQKYLFDEGRFGWTADAPVRSADREGAGP